jgi:hypothetical protein
MPVFKEMFYIHKISVSIKIHMVSKELEKSNKSLFQ